MPRSTTRTSDRAEATPADRPGDDLEIRPVRAEDLDALVDVYLAGARHHAAIDPVVYRVPEQADAAVRLQRRIDERGQDAEYVAAVLNGRIVGSATLSVDGLPHPGSMAQPVIVAELGIAVLDAYRGRGIGRRLIEHLEAWAADRGVDRIVLNMAAANEGAIRLYATLGYVDSSREMRKELGPR